MAIMITDDCINCGACAVECPTEAIYGPGENCRDNGKSFKSFSVDHFFIVISKCDECLSLKKIKCLSICPMDAIKNY